MMHTINVIGKVARVATVCAIATAPFSASFGASWSVKDEDPDNIISNTVHFSKALDQIATTEWLYFEYPSPEAAVTLRLPEGTDYSSTLAPYFKTKTTVPLTIDLKGASWTQNDVDNSTPYTQDKRFSIAFDGKTAVKYAWPDHPLNGAFRLENVLLELTTDSNGEDNLDFRRGTFDFLAPNSITNNGGYLYISGSTRTLPLNINIHSNATLISPYFFIYSNAPTNRINILGGSHYMYALQMRVRDSGGIDPYARTQVKVTNGARLKLGSFSANSGANLHGYRLLVEKDGILDMRGSITQRENAEHDIVFDGGILDSTGISTLYWYTARAYATNATFKTKGFTLSSGFMKLHNSTWSSPELLTIGTSSGLTSLEADGDSNSISFATTLNLGMSAGSTGVLSVASGKATFSSTVSIGGPKNGVGRVYLSGGDTKFAATTYIGETGSGELHVSGGSLAAGNITFVRSGKSAKDTVNKLRQTGGEIKVSGAVALVESTACSGTTASVQLEGGVLETKSFYGSLGCSAYDGSKTSVATLEGNGGTLRAAASTNLFLHSLNSASCGPNGLTVDSDYNITIPQSFSDMDGETGELILTGSGTKTLSGSATTVSRIVVAGGTVVFASGARAASELIVTNGARVVFTDTPATIGITNFVCGDAASTGVIIASSGSTLDFGSAPVTLNKVQLYLDGDFAIAATPHEVMRTSGTVSAATKSAWLTAIGAMGFNADRSYSFSYSEDSGTVSFCMTVSDAIRKFSVESGTVTNSENVAVGEYESIAADVAAGASLTLEGALSEGSMSKTGAGLLYLENAGNYFMRGLESAGGLLSVASVGAIGYATDPIAGLKITGGTFEYRGDGTAATLPGLLWFAAPLVTNALGFKVESPLTVSDVRMDGGAIIKRGTATLTFAPPSGTTMTLASGNGSSGGSDPKAPYSIGDLSDGTGAVPSSGYLGFNIVEGEVRLVGDNSTTVNIPGGIMLGISSTNGREQPSMVVDGVKAFLAPSPWTLHVGSFLAPGDSGTYPTLTIKNGAVVNTYILIVGRMPSTTVRPTITVSNSTWNVYSFRPGYNSYTVPNMLIDDNSVINANGISCWGPSYLYFTNSVLQKNASGDCTTADMHSNCGKWLFGKGSTLRLSSVKTSEPSPCTGFTIAFDGGVWYTGNSTKLFHIYRASKFTFQTLGKGGLTLPVDDGVTLPVGRAISGAGGIVKTGAGTLAFETQGEWNEALTEKTNMTDSVSLAFTGLLDVREGAVTVAADACRTGGAYRVANGASIDFGGNALGAASFAGTGEFSGFSAADATIVSDGSGTAVPQFTSAALSGKTLIDFGHTAESPLEWWEVRNVPIARFSGGTPDVTGWKVSGIGEKGVKGKFAVADGEVRVSLLPGGFKVFFK